MFAIVLVHKGFAPYAIPSHLPVAQFLLAHTEHLKFLFCY